MARLVAAFPGIHIVRRGDPFTTLARAIVGQQISVKAAQTIWDRLVSATDGTGEPIHLDPARVGRTRMRNAAPRRTVARARRSTSATSRAISCPARSIRANGRRSPTKT